MVGEVGAAIGVEGQQRRVAEDPAADAVVGEAVGEQQPVRSLVAEDVEQGVAAAHPHERRQPRPPRVERRRGDDDAVGLDDGERHGDDVAGGRDAAQLVAPRPAGDALGRQPLGRQDVGQHRRRGDHRHDRIVQSVITMIKLCNVYDLRGDHDHCAMQSERQRASDRPAWPELGDPPAQCQVARAVRAARAAGATPGGERAGSPRRAVRHRPGHDAHGDLADARRRRAGGRRRRATSCAVR